MIAEVIAVLEQRVAHLTGETKTNPRSGYAEAMRWRLKEAEHILSKVKELVEKQQ